MTCPNCERYKQSASMWRNKAYELNGTPLPWKRDELWVGLTDEERRGLREWQKIQEELGPVWAPMMLYLYEAIEAKLKEKNT